MSLICVKTPDMSCYVLVEFTVIAQRHNLTPIVKKAYELYFGCKVGHQDKPRAPHICCGACVCMLRKWLQGSRSFFGFAVLMV
jgi:hypothetical protein